MTAMKFRALPAEYEAMQWDGENASAIVEWVQGGWDKLTPLGNPEGTITLQRIEFEPLPSLLLYELIVPTPNGPVRASRGDWIVKGAYGGLHVYRPGTFAAMFEESQPVDLGILNGVAYSQGMSENGIG